MFTHNTGDIYFHAKNRHYEVVLNFN